MAPSYCGASGRPPGSGGTDVGLRARRSGAVERAAVAGVGTAEEAGVTVLDQRRRAAFGDGDDREAAGGGLEDHLAVGVGAAGEEEGVGAGVGARQLLVLEPAEEGGAIAEAGAQLPFLGAAT